jgi:hypothetical protein
MALFVSGACVSYEISKLFVGAERAVWVAPLVSCGFAAFLALQLAMHVSRRRCSRPDPLQAGQRLLKISRKAEPSKVAN